MCFTKYQAGGLTATKGSGGKVTEIKPTGTLTSISAFTDKSKVSAEYIVTTAKYTSSLLKTANGAVIGINFSKNR